MKYRYAQPLPNSDLSSFRRVALLKTTLSHQDNQVDVLAMIDSGADISVFHLDYAILLGINPKDCESVQVEGVGGVAYPCYKTTVDLTPQGLAPVTIPALFIESPGVNALLGQEGFFDRHIITFDRADDSFEVMPKRVT